MNSKKHFIFSRHGCRCFTAFSLLIAACDWDTTDSGGNYQRFDWDIQGTWKDTDNNTWTFNANGGLRWGNSSDGWLSLTYTITNSRLEFTTRGNNQSYTVLVSPDGRTLTLKDGRNYAMSASRGIERAENTLTKQ